MAYKKRWVAKREAILKGTGYDSIFEKRMHETVLKDTSFHNKDDKVNYTISHTYEPDFVYKRPIKESSDETCEQVFLIETKGRFRDSAEARKYLFIREVLPAGTELVFIMEKANTKFPFARRRKDGTTANHEEWLTKNNFRYWIQGAFNIEEL
jgi:hypothetical protein